MGRTAAASAPQPQSHSRGLSPHSRCGPRAATATAVPLPAWLARRPTGRPAALTGLDPWAASAVLA